MLANNKYKISHKCVKYDMVSAMFVLKMINNSFFTLDFSNVPNRKKKQIKYSTHKRYVSSYY